MTARTDHPDPSTLDTIQPIDATAEGAPPAPLTVDDADEIASGATRVQGASLPAVVDEAAAPLDETGFDARYEFRSVLGAGGMGEVRLCKDKRVGREVALKVIQPFALSHPGARERFVREARVQGQLEHPSVVPVYDLGVAPDHTVFFTMKRVRGMPLDKIIRGLCAGDAALTAKYSRRRLLTAFSSVCLAVDFAHARGVLHRDLKPGNVMLGDFGEVHVLDWGLAKIAGTADSDAGGAIDLADEARGQTIAGSTMGTPGYMSPEQARGDVGVLDPRADVYSLGALLFEILALEPLHGQRTVKARLISTVDGVDARPSARAGGLDVPPELDAICVRATAIDRLERHHSAREVADAVERFLDGDRDVQRRKEMAARHADLARVALERAGQGGRGNEDARAEAMREVGRALALDPTHAAAIGTMARLLMTLPDHVPPEAEAELGESAQRARRDAARAGAVRYLTWIAVVPLILWMGVRHWGSGLALLASLLASDALAWWMSRRSRTTPAHGFALLALSSVTIAIVSLVFSSFILVPTLAATNTMFFAMNVDRAARRVVIAAGVLAVSVPIALEALGALPPALGFAGNALIIAPRMADFPVVPTLTFLLLVSAALVITPALLVGRLRDALTAAERRVFLQAWHLRQLVPDEARHALSDPPGDTMPAAGSPAEARAGRAA